MRSSVSVSRGYVTGFKSFLVRFLPRHGDWRPRIHPPAAPARLSRRELLIGLVYVAIAVPGTLCSWQSISKSSAARGVISQSVHFPAERTLGTLYVLARQNQRRASREPKRAMKYWERLDWARGIVGLPPNSLIWLELNPYGLNHLGLLDDLEAQRYYRISIAAGGEPTNTNGYLGLARFTALRELDLRNATIHPDGLSFLEALPQLADLWLPEPDGALERERLVARAAHAGMFESGRNRLQGAIYLRRKPVDK